MRKSIILAPFLLLLLVTAYAVLEVHTTYDPDLEFRVINVTYPDNYLQIAKRPPRLREYTNVTVEYMIINHGEKEVKLDTLYISSNFGGYELGESKQTETFIIPPGSTHSGFIGVDEDWSPVRSIELGMNFDYGLETMIPGLFSKEISQLKPIYVPEPVYPVLVDTNIEWLNRYADEIYNPGLPPDSIPPIEAPEYITLDEASYMHDSDIVYLLESDPPRIFPRRIMLWHEVVNDFIDARDVSITYCPLTESAIGYTVQFMGNTTTFGTSGRLLNSNLVLYDRETQSHWPQIFGTAVEGKWKGVELETFPLLTTTWGRVKEVYPNATVLSTDTGTYRDYNDDPYQTYLARERIQFPVSQRDNRLEIHTKVVGIKYNNSTMAVVKDHIREQKEISFELGGTPITLAYDESLDAARVSSRESEVTFFEVYWFSWYAYYPDTGLIGD